MTTGVVIACAEERLTEQLQTVLSEVTHLQVLDVVTTSAGLLSAAERDDVTVVIVHSGIGPIGAGQITTEIVAARPFLGVVWLAAEGEDGLLASAVEAGARSVLTAPLSVEETQARIDAAAAWSRSLLNHLGGDAMTGRRGRVLAVAGAKGGVGTTLLATLLAGAATGGDGAILVDLDVRNGAVSFYTDVQTHRSIADLAELARELTGRAIREVVHTHTSGLALLLAPEEVDRAEDVTGEAVRLILSQLRLQYGQVVVDCGSRLDDATATAIELADEVCLVTTPDIVAVRAARRTLEMWTRLRLRPADQVNVLLNRVSKRTDMQPDLVRQILRPAPVVGEVPAAFASLEQSLHKGVLDARPGPVHAAVSRLAEVLDLRPERSRRLREEHGRRRAPRVIGGAEAGQSAVELPAVVFLLGMVALVSLQMLVWGITHVFAGHAALEASREASVQAGPAAVGAAVANALPLGWGSGWSVGYPGPNDIAVTVQTPTLVPWLHGLEVTSTSHYEVEP